MTEHKHAWFLRAIADGEPLENFESRHEALKEFSRPYAGYMGGIVGCPHEWEVRRKARMIRIGDTEVQAGITEAPKYGTRVYVADPAQNGFAFSFRWDGFANDTSLIQRGLIHLSEEPAVAMGRALAALTEHKNG